MLARNESVLFIDFAGATIVSCGRRLYVRHHGEYAEVEAVVRVIVGSGFGFVITSDAIGVCVRRHIEIVITDVTQSFTAIYAPYVPCLSSRVSIAARMRQFKAIADPRKRLVIARDIVRRKIHDKPVQTAFLADLETCKSTATMRHIEAKSAQEWWRTMEGF